MTTRPAPGTSIADTPEKELRAALDRAVEERNRMEAIIAAMGDGISVQDPEFRVLYQNRIHRDLLGDHVGRYCYQAYQQRDTVCDGCQLARAFKDGGIHRAERTINHGGMPSYVEITASSLRDGSGRVVAGVEIVRNVTERRTAEDDRRKLVALVENASDLIGIATLDGKIQYVNGAGLRMLGFDSAGEIQGLPVTAFMTAKDIPRFEKQMRSVLEKGSWTGEFRIQRRGNGTPVPVEMHSFTIRDPRSGAPAVFATICRDITERKRTEEELLRSRKLESLGVLAGGIAHDFNNLLTSILGNVTLAKMRMDPEDKTYRRLEEAEKASLRAQELTQQLLTFSKGGAPVRKAASIGELIEESAAFSLRGSNVRCVFDLPADLWPVEVDTGQINQVINNLVINADHAMPRGGTLRIRGENYTAGATPPPPLREGRYVKVSVQDQGVGIVPEHLGRIFDPYFTTKTKGSGLGLATVYSIIRKHGGHVTVDSVPGAGTTFHLFLPAARKSPGASPRGEERIDAGQGRVLVMDDEELVRDVTVVMLESLGYEVVATSDGAEAVDAYRSAREAGNPFRAVIMDLTIPGGMGGVEALHRLAAVDPGVTAIVSSGYSNDPVMSDPGRYGFRGVVRKPFRMGDLGKALREVLGE